MTSYRLTRRNALGVALGAGIALRGGASRGAQRQSGDWLPAPIGATGAEPGDGFEIGHGFACENTWFSAGWWHTGEDWYATAGDTAGASVYAVAAGEVVYADFDYPGRVVIVQHAPDLYSLYGHLDFDLAVTAGQRVTAGGPLGTVLPQADVKSAGQAPSHLHFELRTFLTRDEVNGSAPQFGVNCGFQCPPGPGYWPIGAPQHPAELGWRNPVLQRLDRIDRQGLQLVPQAFGIGNVVSLYTGPSLGMPSSEESVLNPNERLAVLDLVAAKPSSTGTSAEAYRAWFKVATANGREGWVQFAVPSERETGSDGRPSSVDLPFLLAGS